MTATFGLAVLRGLEISNPGAGSARGLIAWPVPVPGRPVVAHLS